MSLCSTPSKKKKLEKTWATLVADIPSEIWDRDCCNLCSILDDKCGTLATFNQLKQPAQRSILSTLLGESSPIVGAIMELVHSDSLVIMATSGTDTRVWVEMNGRVAAVLVSNGSLVEDIISAAIEKAQLEGVNQFEVTAWNGETALRRNVKVNDLLSTGCGSHETPMIIKLPDQEPCCMQP